MNLLQEGSTPEQYVRSVTVHLVVVAVNIH